MELIAHRGACFDAPENSTEAFERAVELGVDRIELDVQMSADGVPVVHHDEDTGRMTDRKLVIAQSTHEELRALRLANGEAIPTFAEVCERLAGRVELDVELKDARPELVQQVLQIMDRHGFRTQSLISSFHAPVLRRALELGFPGRRGLVLGSTSLKPAQRLYEMHPFPALRRLQATDLIIHHRLVMPWMRALTRRRDLNLLFWMSLDDEAQQPTDTRARWYQAMRRKHPDGVIFGRLAEGSPLLRR